MLTANDNICPAVCPVKFENKHFTTAIYHSVILPWNLNDFEKFYDEAEKRRIQILTETKEEKKKRKESTKDNSMKGIPQILLGVAQTGIEESLDKEDEPSDSETVTD